MHCVSTDKIAADHSHRFRTACRHGLRTLRHSIISVSKTQYLINPLQANEVSAVWGRAASSLLLAAHNAFAPKRYPRTPRK